MFVKDIKKYLRIVLIPVLELVFVDGVFAVGIPVVADGILEFVLIFHDLLCVVVQPFIP